MSPLAVKTKKEPNGKRDVFAKWTPMSEANQHWLDTLSIYFKKYRSTMNEYHVRFYRLLTIIIVGGYCTSETVAIRRMLLQNACFINLG